MQLEVDKAEENVAKQIRYSQQLQRQIDDLTKKIESFNENQKDLVEKSRFKAGSYMNEINARDEELSKMRQQVMQTNDEHKILTMQREQYRKQNQAIEERLKAREAEAEKLRIKVEEQAKVIDNLCLVQKNYGNYASEGSVSFEKQKEDIEKAERIARSLGKSSFMALGDKPIKLVSEEGLNSSGAAKLSSPWDQNKDEVYLNDESIPSEVFGLVQRYKDMLKSSRGSSQVMLIDDFFAEVHKVLKDSHMREIARIRNEHSVEIMRLRKSLDSQLSKSPMGKSNRSKENFNAYQASDKFIENEIERQRRVLLEENELLKKRLRAVETIIQSSSNERAKFMEGASWIAKKANDEIDKHSQKMRTLVEEFQKRQKQTIIDESIFEMNGREVLKLYSWVMTQVTKETQDVGSNFDLIFENVNYHLKEATKEFGKYRA